MRAFAHTPPPCPDPHATYVHSHTHYLLHKHTCIYTPIASLPRHACPHMCIHTPTASCTNTHGHICTLSRLIWLYICQLYHGNLTFFCQSIPLPLNVRRGGKDVDHHIRLATAAFTVPASQMLEMEAASRGTQSSSQRYFTCPQNCCEDYTIEN